MTRLKIASNPYKKEIRYWQWDDADSTWLPIDLGTHKSSKLLNKEFTLGFFPFKAREIVSQIIEDYQIDEEPIELYFEGSSDEFDELMSVCKVCGYEGVVNPLKEDKYLENARDILPKVKALFQKMSPLIEQSIDHEKIEKDLSRFRDASSDVVPVCVLGNYSSGKSTFINALIGSEILPNGTNPVTAKIYEITRSRDLDRATISLNYLGQEITLKMTAQDSYFEGLKVPNELSDMLSEQVISMTGESITLRMSKAIKIINDYESDDEDGLSDLIKIEIPFVNGILASSLHPFVIFDTPGSNSASNEKHIKVLNEAMASMTNGLPIFLATPDTLDSTDNQHLYEMMSKLVGLDNRFTMILVNKADKNDLNRKGSTEKEEKIILRQAIPRNLYSGGIFYVSSIMGLGSKNGGDFLDDFYDETFEDQERKYRDPANKRYKRLYQYNIMPAQIKEKSNREAELEKNLIYANSGLYSVETEIETFAGKYAAYNKCFQSQMFLHHIIDLTQESIDEKGLAIAEDREIIRERLETDKKALLDKLEKSSEEKKTEYQAGYEGYMGPFTTGASETFSTESLKQLEDVMTAKVEVETGFEQYEDKARKSSRAILSNLGQHASRVAKEKSLDSVKNAFSRLRSDLGTAVDDLNMRAEARKSIDCKVADELMSYTRDEFIKKLKDIFESMVQGSQKYWTSNTEALRNILAKIVTGSEVLSAERKDELERIIIEYKKLNLDLSHADIIFRIEEFERKLKIGTFVLWRSDHLDLEKLSETYNEHIKEDVQKRYEDIESSHRESAYLWIENLLDAIRTNIVEYSPGLSKYAKRIQDLTREIEELSLRKKKLKDYTIRLDEMIDWKIREEA